MMTGFWTRLGQPQHRRRVRRLLPDLEKMEDRALLTSIPIAISPTAGPRWPSVAMNRTTGQSVVAWDNGTDVFFRLYSSSGVASAIVNVTNNGTSGTTEALGGVDMDDSGNFVLFVGTVLSSGTGYKTVQVFNSSGTPLASPFTVPSTAVGGKLVGAAIDNADDIFLLTTKPPAVDSTPIKLTKLVPSGASYTVTSYTVDVDAVSSALSVNRSTGQAVVTWADGPSSLLTPPNGFYFRLLSSGGSLGTKTNFFTPPGTPSNPGTTGNTSVSMNNSGNFVVGYSFTDGALSRQCIGAAEFNSSGSTIISPTVVQYYTSPGLSLATPSVSINNNGVFVETWLVGPGPGSSYFGIQDITHSTSTGWSGVNTVEGYDVINNSNPNRWTVLSDAGTIFTVWYGVGSSGTGHYGWRGAV